MEKIELIEPAEPNLLTDVFPHDTPPHIIFDGPITEQMAGRTYTIDPDDLHTRDIFITDTTFRDGQQSRPPYTVEQIVKLYELLSRLSGPNGIIRQTEFFIYSDADRQALEKCRELGFRFPEITGWIRAEPEDLNLALKMGLKETGMLTSCSDYHIFHKLKLDRRRAMDKYLALATEAIS